MGRSSSTSSASAGGCRDTAHASAVEALVKSVYDADALDDMIARAREKVTENALTDNFAAPSSRSCGRVSTASTPTR